MANYEPKENETILYDDGTSWREGIWRDGNVFSPVHGYIRNECRITKMPPYGKGRND